MKAFIFCLFLSLSGTPAFADSLFGNAGFSEVIGGSRVTEPNLLHATVGIFFNDNSKCSGAYIGNNKVVTAGHCVLEARAKAVSFVGSKENISCRVVSQLAYPDYKEVSDMEYDVAVLKIQCATPLNVTPFQLAAQPHAGEKLFTAGYGATVPNSTDFHFPRLQALPITDYDWTRIQKDPDQKLMDEILKDAEKADEVECFAANIQGTAFSGDSGGPIYAQNADGTYTLFAINGQLILGDIKVGAKSVRM
ncbi:MAG: trypsin-like serine protease, partial [Bdellovibrionota bacterium]